MVHKRVPVIFRGSMLNKNPWTCRTSSGQGMGQRFSMRTHTKYITHRTKSASHKKFKRFAFPVSGKRTVKSWFCLPLLWVHFDYLGVTEQAVNTILARYHLINWIWQVCSQMFPHFHISFILCCVSRHLNASLYFSFSFSFSSHFHGQQRSIVWAFLFCIKTWIPPFTVQLCYHFTTRRNNMNDTVTLK